MLGGRAVAVAVHDDPDQPRLPVPAAARNGIGRVTIETRIKAGADTGADEPWIVPSRMCNETYSAGISECTIRMSIPCERRTKRETT